MYSFLYQNHGHYLENLVNKLAGDINLYFDF